MTFHNTPEVHLTGFENLSGVDATNVNRTYADPERHPVPHFHARYGEHQASFTIEPPTQLAGMVPRRQLLLILAWAQLHNNELQENWRRILNQEPLHKIDGLR